MVNFTLNGNVLTVPKSDKKLMDYLRRVAQITSVKDGCSSGACGTCTIILDGKAVRSCVVKISNMDGKNVVTIEGLNTREKAVYSYAFAECGAVQCGFCIPGMILSAKAMIDLNPTPTRKDVKTAIRGNICRCTGYVKIEEAILLAAKMLRENVEIPPNHETGEIGTPFHRIDANEKTLGTGKYADDLTFPDMLYGKAIRLNVARAQINGIDPSEAEKHVDFAGFLTAKDIQGAKVIGHLVHDWDVLIEVDATTRYGGDAVAVVLSRCEDTLKDIANLVKVDFTELVPVENPKQSLEENAPKLHKNGNILSHQHMRRGDPETAIKNAHFVVTNTYFTPFTEHAFLEPECAVAILEGDGVRLFSASQNIYEEQHEISLMLNLPPEKVRVSSMLVGGGFGGKEDMSVQHHAALATWVTKKPVKIRLTREESILVHPKRHAMEISMTSACDKEGNLLAVTAKVVADTGAYASLGGPVLQRACTHAAGPYVIENVDIDGIAVYTNNPPGGAFRGFGVCQTVFASETNLDLLAEKVGISPWEIRMKNAVRPGQTLSNGQIADENTSLVECLEAVKDVYEQNPYAGISSAFKNSGLGVGVPDFSRCTVSVDGGKIHVRASAACIGQGMATVEMQIACQTLGVLPEMVVVENPDTARTPHSGGTTSSRQTVFTGEALRLACLKLKAELSNGKTLENLEGSEFYAEFSFTTDPIDSDKPNPVSHITYGYGAQVAVLDEQGGLQKVVAAYDVGTPINVRAVEGQIEGGVAMGLGYALTEDYPLVNCLPTAKFGTLGLFRAPDVPEIETILVRKNLENIQTTVAYGAKGVGELATIPTAPAVSGAYYKLDKQFRDKLPLENTYYRKKK